MLFEQLSLSSLPVRKTRTSLWLCFVCGVKDCQLKAGKVAKLRSTWELLLATLNSLMYSFLSSSIRGWSGSLIAAFRHCVKKACSSDSAVYCLSLSY